MLVFRTDGCLSISKPRTIYDFLSVLIATSHAQEFFSSTYALLLFSQFPMLLFSSTYESSAVSLHPWPRTAHVGSTHRHNSSRARGGSVHALVEKRPFVDGQKVYLVLSDIWARDTRNACIFDHVFLSDWSPRQRWPMKGKQIYQLGGQGVSNISGAVVSGR